MAELTGQSLFSRSTSLLLALTFGVLALLLAAVGIYRVLVYLIAQRRREIGIRVALRSTQAGVVNLVLWEGFVLVGIGLLGVAGAVSLRTVVATELYGVASLDPLVIGGVAIVFGAVALAAYVMPERHAMQVNPAIVLSEQ
jgi:putative ABC transport system permease protein